MIRRVLVALAIAAAAFGAGAAHADQLCVDVHIPDGELREFPYCVTLP